MLPTLYIHIGAHKTATTSVQFWLTRNRDALLRHGLLYPDTNAFHFAQHRLAFALRQRRDKHRGDVPDLDAEVAQLRAAVLASNAPAALVSSEDFFASRRKNVLAFRKTLDFCKPVILATVRRQDDFLISSYDQNAKTPGNGFTKPLRYFVENPRKVNADISFWKHLQTWSEVFGQDAVRLKRYEDAPPLAAMFSWLDLPESLLPDSQPALNKSRPALASEAVRHAKKLGLSFKAQHYVLRLVSRIASKGKGYQLCPADRRRILAEFAEENDAMFAAFGMENTYRP
jgi:hypothetical protein